METVSTSPKPWVCSDVECAISVLWLCGFPLHAPQDQMSNPTAPRRGHVSGRVSASSRRALRFEFRAQ